jgi:hypothetical protein
VGESKCNLCLKKKQAKKVIFDPKIALRVELSDPARNSFFPADFLSARLECSQFLWNCAKIKGVYRRARGERGLDHSTDDRSELQHDSQPWQNRI